MKLQEKEIPLESRLEVILYLEDGDGMGITYDEFESKLIEECKKSNFVADKLLMYEMICRKIEKSKLKTKEDEK